MLNVAESHLILNTMVMVMGMRMGMGIGERIHDSIRCLTSYSNNNNIIILKQIDSSK